MGVWSRVEVVGAGKPRRHAPASWQDAKRKARKLLKEHSTTDVSAKLKTLARCTKGATAPIEFKAFDGSGYD